jgi:uncharacterized RDD family membrane protein YckC
VSSAPAAAVTPRDARPTLAVRLLAATYEAVLLFGLVVAAGAALLLVVRWPSPLSSLQRWTLQGWLFLIVGAYFVWCWTQSGQTLAMKTWRLRVERQGGGLLGMPTAIARYLLAWYLVLPGLLLASWLGHSALSAGTAFGAGLLAVAALSLTDRDHRLLHDRLLLTRVVRLAREPRHRIAP